jgi:transmembrane sensor
MGLESSHMDRGSNSVSEREAAAAWHDRLHREKVSDETRRAFADWLTESARHMELYESIDRVWTKLQTSAEDPQILALRHETALRLTRRASATGRSLRWVAAAALFVVGVAVVTAVVRPAGEHFGLASLLDVFRLGGADHYETVTGERLAFALRDGSQVTLDTQSELKVDFTATERIVRLRHGQAFFEVAKDPRKPFVVEVRGRRFVAVGTAFDVRVDGDQVKVTMVEGTVRVEPPHPEPPSRTGQGIQVRHPDSLGGSATPDNQDPPGQLLAVVATITAGEQLVTNAQREDHVRPADSERSTSWRRGQLVFENTRLADAIAELNRYSDAKIQLEDADLADLRLSGVFATGRPTVFVEAVTAYFPIQITRADDRAVVLSKRR